MIAIDTPLILLLACIYTQPLHDGSFSDRVIVHVYLLLYVQNANASRMQ